jgi:cytidyltransferase-like protein
MVSGCFDMLHSGHVAFLEEAASYGELHVCIGNDENILQLKNRPVAQTQEERAYLLESLRCVAAVYIDQGMGKLDFIEEMKIIQPDIFIVNEDGHDDAKLSLCQSQDIEYIVLKRTPKSGLPARSTTQLRNEDLLPYRIDLAGGWLDQPFVSSVCPGAVITLNIWPTIQFNNRSGMASSTRKSAQALWGNRMPMNNEELLAKTLFAFDNPPGTKNISGSQDAIGLVFRGVNKLDYQGDYWPTHIEQCLDEDVLNWLESVLYLVPISPRAYNFEVLSKYEVTNDAAHRLARAAEEVWDAIVNQNIESLGKAMKASLMAQLEMFPLMWNEEAEKIVSDFSSDVLGYKVSGAGGGGYVVAVAKSPIPNSIQVKVRTTR